MSSKPKLLVFVVAYNAEKTIQSVLTRIPAELADEYKVEILIIDDASKDATFEKGEEIGQAELLPFPVWVLHNPANQGYGGNQKIGYHYAIEKNFDFVALLHGDGQYAPECLPQLVRPLKEDAADAVIGSRMMIRGSALNGGMPLYKFVGNRILTWLENKVLRTSLSEFHSGYRVYRVSALRRIPFHLNTKDFHFDTEIIIQLTVAQLRILELPIPTYYGDEICYVNGFKYAWHVSKAAIKARLQELSLFYDRKFDCAPGHPSNAHYVPKLGYPSSHSAAIEAIKTGERVVDLGCAGGYFGEQLRVLRKCDVTGVDHEPLPSNVILDRFIKHDLDAGLPEIDYHSADVIVLLDVIEHLRSPEGFVESLARVLTPKTRVIVTSGNVAFFITRLMLFLGQFNYGKRGILDITHARLFTFSSLRALFEQAGFELLRSAGIPAPYPLAFGNTWLAKALLRINQTLIRISKGLFSYQLYYEFRATPSLSLLLDSATETAEKRIGRKLAA